MRKTNGAFNLYRFQLRIFPALLGWALGSIASGILWMRNGDGQVRGFGSQFAGWGAINLLLALFGLNSARRNLSRQAQGEVSPAGHERQAQSFERLVLVNAGLDAGYIAAGAWLASTPIDKPQKHPGLRRGMGWGIVAQGGFLLAWDLLLVALVHRRQKT
jgi:Family of unknown function (DUF6992)